jgi:hypothetical protein
MLEKISPAQQSRGSSRRFGWNCGWFAEVERGESQRSEANRTSARDFGMKELCNVQLQYVTVL